MPKAKEMNPRRALEHDTGSSTSNTSRISSTNVLVELVVLVLQVRFNTLPGVGVVVVVVVVVVQ